MRSSPFAWLRLCVVMAATVLASAAIGDDARIEALGDENAEARAATARSRSRAIALAKLGFYV